MIERVLDDGVDVYAFFKHEDAPDAPAFATRLLELTGVKQGGTQVDT